MAEMIIKRRWWDILYPYAVVWKDAYRLHHTQAGSDAGKERFPQGPYYVIEPRVHRFLEELPLARFLFIKRPGCLYKYRTKRFPFMLRAHGGTLVNPYPVPPILLARKSDALMLKLTCGGR